MPFRYTVFRARKSKTWLRGGKYLIFSCIAMLLLNVMVTSPTAKNHETPPSSTTFEGRLLGPLAADDEAVVQVLRDRYLVPPSQDQYQLENYDNFTTKVTSHLIQDVKKLFLSPTRVTEGFFVEAGALDGQYNSNTLYLETHLNWTGLLIEPNSKMFQSLLEKNRKCWSANICLSPKPYPYQATLRKLNKADEDTKVAILGLLSMSSLVTDDQDDRTQYGYSTYDLSQCFPIESVLLALNVTTITMFSLDVEGLEWPILQHFPFHSVRVEVWLVEHRLVGSGGEEHPWNIDHEFIKWFKERGYRLVASNPAPIDVRDYIFVLEDSPYANTRL